MENYQSRKASLWVIKDSDQRTHELSRLEAERTIEDPIRYLYFVNHHKFPLPEVQARLSSALRTIAAELPDYDKVGPEAKMRIDAAIQTLKLEF